MPDLDSDSLSPYGDGITSEIRYVDGMAEPESLVYIYLNGQPLEQYGEPSTPLWAIAHEGTILPDEALRRWRLNVQDSLYHLLPLAPGRHTLSTVVYDLAGNPSPQSEERVIWIKGDDDTGLPEVRISGGGTFSEDSVPPVSFTTTNPDFTGPIRLNWSGTARAGSDYTRTYELELAPSGSTELDFFIDDTVNIGTGWTQQPNETIAAITFDVFTQGAAVLKIEQVSPASDLAAISFNANSDHVLGGKTTVTVVIENIGTASAGAFTSHVFWSANNVTGDAGDMLVGNGSIAVSGLAPGESSTQTITVQLDQATLYAHALASNPVGASVGTASTEADHLFLVVDVNNDVVEGDEANNTDRGHLIDNEDITYFPWDKNGNGVVEPLEALTSIQAIGTADAARDLDGNGIVSPLEALSALHRIGYMRNETVFEASPKRNSLLIVSPPALQSKSMIPATAALRSVPAPSTSSPSPAFFAEADDDRDLFASTGESPDLPIIIATETVPTADIDNTFLSRVDWLSAI